MATGQHPEQRSGELFLGNFDASGWPSVGWKTKRAGKVAYGKNGKALGKTWPGSFPGFVQESEITNPAIVSRLKSYQAEYNAAHK